MTFGLGDQLLVWINRLTGYKKAWQILRPKLFFFVVLCLSSYGFDKFLCGSTFCSANPANAAQSLFGNASAAAKSNQQLSHDGVYPIRLVKGMQ